jgi:hypothetical protein
MLDGNREKLGTVSGKLKNLSPDKVPTSNDGRFWEIHQIPGRTVPRKHRWEKSISPHGRLKWEVTRGKVRSKPSRHPTGDREPAVG